MAAIALIATLASTAISAYSSISQGNTQSAMLNAEAQRKEIQAGQERAAAQQEMEQKRRETDRALGAYTVQSQGSGAYDPTYQVAGEIASRGFHEERWAGTRGDQRAIGLEDEANLKRASGAAARQSGILGAVGAVAKGAAGFAKEIPSGGSTFYGGGGSSWERGTSVQYG